MAISNAFRSAYTNYVNAQTQGINNISGGVKSGVTAVMGGLGFAGALGKGVIATGAKYALANKIGGVGGSIMLATLHQKESSAKEQKDIAEKSDFSRAEVQNTIESTLGDNPINRAAKKQLSTVFDKILEAKEAGYIDKKSGMLDTSLGPVDPNSALGKSIMGAM